MKKTPRLEDLLAVLLRYGSTTASVVIGVGYALALFGAPSRVVRAGIVLFILLPIIRVLMMLLVYLRRRDYRFACISGMVFAIIIFGIYLGIPA